MNRPKMIIFDYGQTLVTEKPFDGLKGTRAVLSKLQLMVILLQRRKYKH